MVQRFRLLRRSAALTAALLSAAAVSGPSLLAQYTCFPSCATNDARMLALAGSSSSDAFAGNEITVGIGMAPNTTTLEIGIFDGDTGGKDANNVGHWDLGTMALEYRLYADPTGDGTNLTLLDTYSGTSMADNAWSTISRSNSSAAQATNGNYVYLLRVTMPSSTSTSAFKLRTNGTITIKSHQQFSISAPLTGNADAAIVYPDFNPSDFNNPANYVRKNYDGTWKIYLDVPQACSALKIWDGDMDHGSAAGQSPAASDVDDANTENVVPSWATGNAVAEGAADANPKDDNAAVYNRHSPAVRYDVIFPDNVTTFANNNPSGNLEWEQFRVDTQSSDASVTDATATAIPAGIYTIRLAGMDMLNVNAWRFFNDVSGVAVNDNEVIGVNEAGLPVAPIRAIETVNGSVSGTIYYDSDANQTQGPGEPGLPTVTVMIHKLGTDGVTVISTVTTSTDIDGNYTFSQLGAGAYKIEVDANTLQNDVIATVDADGASSAHTAVIEITANTSNVVAPFGYKRSTVVSTGTRGYWTNHRENWPIESMTLGGVTYDANGIMGILKRPTKGDKAYSMAAQLIATKFNLAAGSQSSCIGSDVVAADAWLSANPLNGGKTSASAWNAGSATHDKLDDYNNGRLCAPHMN